MSFKQLTMTFALGLVAAVMFVEPAGAGSPSPAKAFWYADNEDLNSATVLMHVSAQKSNQIDFLRADAGCAFYDEAVFSDDLPVKLNSKGKFSVNASDQVYSSKDQMSATVTLKMNGRFSGGKFIGKYTISDDSTECTAAQKKQHSYTAKKRTKESGG